MNLDKVFQRVCNWNAARYEREYNKALSVDLLTEELTEWYDADKQVDRLDALCDTIYVALGVVWKSNVNPETLESIAEQANDNLAKLINTETFMPIHLASAALLEYRSDEIDTAVYSANLIMFLCLTQMTSMGLTPEEQEAALLVVCDSNDSKSIKKTESHIKANDGDKGPYFQPPEVRLQAILNEVANRHGN